MFFVNKSFNLSLFFSIGSKIRVYKTGSATDMIHKNEANFLKGNNWINIVNS